MFALKSRVSLSTLSISKQAATRILTIERGVARANRTILAVNQHTSTRLISSSSHAPKSALSASHVSIAVDDGGTKPPPRIPAAIDFSDSSAAHGQKTTYELLRALAVFRVCQVKWIVDNAKMLLNISNRVLGATITDAIVGRTFYKHFCAGRDSVDMKPVIDMLQRNGVRPILDYAAESEGGGESADEGVSSEDIVTQPPFNQPARVYAYKSEEECDRHVEIFRDCIHSVRDVSPCGFAALKVTALGNPELLERMSTMIVETKKLFSRFDAGATTYEQFKECYRQYFRADDDEIDNILQNIDLDKNGMIDYIEFAEMMHPCNLPSFTQKCTEVGPLALATPSDEEIVLMQRTSERLHTLAQESADCGTKLLIDAEHLKYQPAIDSLVLELQRKFNDKSKTDRPVIFNTYQCYLKDAAERAQVDLERSERFNFHFAAKIVRGAYLHHERDRAEKLGYPNPIHDSKEETDRCYDAVVEQLLRHRSERGPGLEVMVASHNKESIERAVHLMQKLGIQCAGNPSVHFAQLYGMCDNLTFTLGKANFNAFKYLPYGSVGEVIPYLLRRAEENGAVLDKTGDEINLLIDELKRRYSLDAR